jgi:hypothetical protein
LSVTGDAYARLAYFSRRFRVEGDEHGHLRLSVVDTGDDNSRRWRRGVRGVALVGSALFICVPNASVDTALQWLATCSLGALLLTYGLVRGLPLNSVFAGPVVDMVRAALEISPEHHSRGYRGAPDTKTVLIDSQRVAAVDPSDAGATEIRTLRFRTDVFVVTAEQAIFVERFRDEHDAIDFVYYLAEAIGVPCEERGVVPTVRGLPWESPKAVRRQLWSYEATGQGLLILVVFLIAVMFAAAHVVAPAATASELGVRCIAYIALDFVLQDVVFARRAKRDVELRVRAAFGLLPS